MKWIMLFAAMLSTSVNAHTLDEIEHLLAFVKDTNCVYERNGKQHTGTEAVEHIKKKYDYYSEEIDSAEDFIKYAATKSKMSGDYYMVHCPDQPAVKSKTWLLAELASYRATHP